jgi:DNA polymerase-1
LVFEADVEFVPRMLAEIKTRMEAAADLKVPLLVEAGTGDNWNESH